MALRDIVEQTVSGLGYDLVEIERSAGGLLRITIDLPWTAQPSAGPSQGGLASLGGGEPHNAGACRPQPEQFINVEDCEKVNRQLQFALEVDGIECKRLEISSPGIDRPLRHAQLEKVVAADGAAGWQIVWSDAPPVKPGQKVSKRRIPPPLQALGFTLDELRESRLAPIVSFKGRGGPGGTDGAEVDTE